MPSFKDRLAAAGASMINTSVETYKEVVGAEEPERRGSREMQLRSTLGFLRLYPDYLEWKLGVGAADDVQRVAYGDITSVSMGGSIKPVGGVTGIVVSGGLNLMAAKQKTITLDVHGAVHTFAFNMESTETVRKAVDLITHKSLEAKKRPESVAAATTSSAADEIAKLAALHRDGVLTDEEFTSAKTKLLRAT